MMTNHPPAVSVFISYAPADDALRLGLENHLAALRREGFIAAWHAGRVGAGEETTAEVQAHLDAAGIILLLVSADFLASDTEWDAQVMPALARHQVGAACVIPVILRPCDWQSAPFGRLQALPKDGRPVTAWPDRDEAFLDVARGIRAAVENLPAAGAAFIPGARRPGPRVWNVPFARNPNFTGRMDLLAQIDAALAAGRGAALTQPQAIHGLGGVGKTQLALEYAYRHADEYDVVWWLRAEEPVTLASDYAGLAAPLGLPERLLAEQPAIVAAVRRWLETHDRWLLVFDNAPDPAAVAPYLPAPARGGVLVTSRHARWRGTFAHPVDVATFIPDEALSFLLVRSGRSEGQSANDLKAAKDLCRELGDLPLALEHAAAYVEENGRSFSSYLTLYRSRRKELLAQIPDSANRQEAVATTWDISLKAVLKEKGGKAAGALLNLCSFFAPDDIPRDMISSGAEHLPQPLASAVADPMRFDGAVAALARYSLVEASNDTLSVHRLVQAVVRDRLGEEARRTWAAAACHVVNAAFPINSDDVRAWPVCLPLLPHTTSVIENVEEARVADSHAARLLNQLGLYVRARAEFRVGRDYHERALRIVEAAHELDESATAVYVNNLGNALRELGELAGAKACYERALRIQEAAYGSDHPTVAIDVNNLGGVLQDLGDLSGAKACYERALRIDEAVYGPDHPTVAVVANNLGNVLQDLGDLAGAKACFERALRIQEATYGPDHPTVAIDVNNLGLVLKAQGDLAGAKACYERALRIQEAVYGSDHPTVAIDLNNLGGVLQAQGDLAGAKACLERALRIDEAVYGPDHPTVAVIANNLGSALQDSGDLAGARACYERALRIQEAAYGPDHPTVAIDVSNLGGVLQAQGDLAGAKACHERALRIQEAVYGPDHPTVGIDVNNLGGVLQAQGDLAGAKACFERGLRIQEAAYGPDHPTVAIGVNNLGGVLQAQGDLAGARVCYERALRIFRRFLGDDHPNTQIARRNLDSLGGEGARMR